MKWNCTATEVKLGCVCLLAVGRVLLKAGAVIGAQDNDGWTPLHAAAHWGQMESCEILAQNFASFKAIDYAVCICRLIFSTLYV